MTFNPEQHKEDIIKNAVLMLQKAHKNHDSNLLNYASNLLDSNRHLKNFDILLNYYGNIYLSEGIK